MIIYRLQTVKPFNVTFALKVTLTIYLFYNLCRFALELSTNILTMIILSSFKVTSTIYFTISADVFLYCLTLGTNILIMISFYPSMWHLLYIYFTFSVDFPLLYWLASSTSILIMIHLLSRWSVVFILQSLHSCTRHTKYKDICNNLLSAGMKIILKKSITSVY